MHKAHAAGKSLVSPRQLALTYDRVISAQWRGEMEAAAAFDTWFEAHWSTPAPPEPDDPPEGTSVLGASGSGIRWYARGEAVLGYVSRRPGGCYRVRINEAVPLLTASWDAAAPRPDADRLLHHTGASPAAAQSTSVDPGPAAGQSRAHGESTRPQDAVPEKPGRRDLVEPDASRRQTREGDGLAGQQPVLTEVLVAVNVMEPAPAGQ